MQPTEGGKKKKKILEIDSSDDISATINAENSSEKNVDPHLSAFLRKKSRTGKNNDYILSAKFCHLI